MTQIQITGYSNEQFAEAARAQQEIGGVFLVGRIMVQNVPELENAVIVNCDSCGRECWKRLDLEPDPLPPGIVAVCTECMLRRRVPKQR